MVNRLSEATKGYSSAVYQALDDTYVSDWDHSVDPEFIQDNVELFMWNDEPTYKEIFNTRRPAHSVAYEGLMKLFQTNVRDADVNVRITSEMVKQWCKKHGIDYKELLAPIVDRINEEREDRKREKSEAVSKVRRLTIKESADNEIARKAFVSLIHDDWGYTVLNDGYFVCKILATDDEDAIRQFNEFITTDWKQAWKDGTLPRYYGESVSRKSRRMRLVQEAAWTAPNGKKYGKQKRSSAYDYRFTRRELQDMVDSGIATAISDSDKAWKILDGKDGIIGISWNDTNGYTSGVLFRGKDGNLYVGNTAVAQVIV